MCKASVFDITRDQKNARLSILSIPVSFLATVRFLEQRLRRPGDGVKSHVFPFPREACHQLFCHELDRRACLLARDLSMPLACQLSFETAFQRRSLKTDKEIILTLFCAVQTLGTAQFIHCKPHFYCTRRCKYKATSSVPYTFPISPTVLITQDCLNN